MKAKTNFCPYKDWAGLCCHKGMVLLKTMRKVRCPYNNVQKCKLRASSVSLLGQYNDLQSFTGPLSKKMANLSFKSNGKEI